MTNEIIEKASHHMDRSIEAIRETFHTVRAGKASTSVLDGVRVDYYGTPTPISQVANVSVPEARMILVQPWEKKMLDVIQKAIMTSDLGLNPGNDGNVIRVPLPELTEERRRDLVRRPGACVPRSGDRRSTWRLRVGSTAGADDAQAFHRQLELQ